MDHLNQYLQTVQSKLHVVWDQVEKIKQSGNYVAGTLSTGGTVYTFGTGHSNLLAEEPFYRAGGFARLVPIYHEPLMLHQDPVRSTEIERTPGLAAKILEAYPVAENDTVFIISNSGRNAVCLEMALLCSEKGAKVIVITSLKHSLAYPSRHESGKRLYELGHVFVDNGGEIGDACISVGNAEQKVGATSTVIGALIIQAIMVHAASELAKNKQVPEIFSSANSDEGDAHNSSLILRYGHLYPGKA
jgi:uncharacterized phosphosugar-binding protein